MLRDLLVGSLMILLFNWIEVIGFFKLLMKLGNLKLE